MKSVLGYILIAAALLVILFTYAPLAKEEVLYQYRQISNKQVIQDLVPVDKDFGLIIPKLGINVKVIKNVDPFDPNIYQKALTKGVAHAKGSSLPDQDGNVFIFSHSSENFYEALRYNSIFYLLGKLNTGDEIDLYYLDKKYVYRIFDKKIADPNEVSYLQNSSKDNTLTLMTCFPPGTTFKRLMILAKKEQ